MFRRVLLPIMAILIGSMILGSPQTADAAFKLRLDAGNNGSWEINVEDQVFVGPNPDENATPGVVEWSDPLGAFTVVVSVGSSKPALGGGEMDLLQLAISGGPGVVAIELTDTDFSLGANLPYLFSVGGTSTADRTLLTFEAGGGDSNTEFDLTPGTGPLPGVPGDGTNFSVVGTFGPTSADPFSLTIRAVVTHQSAGQITSFDAHLKPLPGPGAFVLLGTAVPCFVGGLVRRKKANAA